MFPEQMKLKQLIGPKRKRRVRPALVVAELDFVHVRREPFDDGAGLAAPQGGAGDVQQDGNDGQRNARSRYSSVFTTAIAFAISEAMKF